MLEIVNSECIGCGCTDFQACVHPVSGDPCSWLSVDRERGIGVCSECESELPRWEAGDCHKAARRPIRTSSQ